MMETMENTIEEVEYKHLQLTSVLKSISHGILVIDIDGNIILINDEPLDATNEFVFSMPRF